MNADAPEWVKRVVDYAEPLVPPGFFGRVEINMFDGEIRGVNVEQAIKLKKGSVAKRVA